MSKAKAILFAILAAAFCAINVPLSKVLMRHVGKFFSAWKLRDRRDDGQHRSPLGEPPVICNCFYHEEVRKTAKKS